MHAEHVSLIVVTCLIILCCFDFCNCDDSITKCLNQMNKENLRNCLHKVKMKRDNVRSVVNVSKIIEHELSKDSLNNKSLSGLEETLSKKMWKFDISEGLEMQVKKADDESVLIKFHTKDVAVMQRKMQMMSMKNIMPYMIIPGFLMAGLLPWIMPGIKMVVMTVSMVNQMVFNAALFGLIRSYVFDTEKEEHIVYINHGYKTKQKQHHVR
jgi:hypothetical protein